MIRKRTWMLLVLSLICMISILFAIISVAFAEQRSNYADIEVLFRQGDMHSQLGYRENYDGSITFDASPDHNAGLRTLSEYNNATFRFKFKTEERMNFIVEARGNQNQGEYYASSVSYLLSVKSDKIELLAPNDRAVLGSWILSEEDFAFSGFNSVEYGALLNNENLIEIYIKITNDEGGVFEKTCKLNDEQSVNKDPGYFCIFQEVSPNTDLPVSPLTITGINASLIPVEATNVVYKDIEVLFRDGDIHCQFGYKQNNDGSITFEASSEHNVGLRTLSTYNNEIFRFKFKTEEKMEFIVDARGMKEQGESFPSSTSYLLKVTNEKLELFAPNWGALWKTWILSESGFAFSGINSMEYGAILNDAGLIDIHIKITNGEGNVFETVFGLNSTQSTSKNSGYFCVYQDGKADISPLTITGINAPLIPVEPTEVIYKNIEGLFKEGDIHCQFGYKQNNDGSITFEASSEHNVGLRTLSTYNNEIFRFKFKTEEKMEFIVDARGMKEQGESFPSSTSYLLKVTNEKLELFAPNWGALWNTWVLSESGFSFSGINSMEYGAILNDAGLIDIHIKITNGEGNVFETVYGLNSTQSTSKNPGYFCVYQDGKADISPLTIYGFEESLFVELGELSYVNIEDVFQSGQMHAQNQYLNSKGGSITFIPSSSWLVGIRTNTTNGYENEVFRFKFLTAENLSFFIEARGKTENGEYWGSSSSYNFKITNQEFELSTSSGPIKSYNLAELGFELKGYNSVEYGALEIDERIVVYIKITNEDGAEFTDTVELSKAQSVNLDAGRFAIYNYHTSTTNLTITGYSAPISDSDVEGGLLLRETQTIQYTPQNIEDFIAESLNYTFLSEGAGATIDGEIFLPAGMDTYYRSIKIRHDGDGYSDIAVRFKFKYDGKTDKKLKIPIEVRGRTDNGQWMGSETNDYIEIEKDVIRFYTHGFNNTVVANIDADFMIDGEFVFVEIGSIILSKEPGEERLVNFVKLSCDGKETYREVEYFGDYANIEKCWFKIYNTFSGAAYTPIQDITIMGIEAPALSKYVRKAWFDDSVNSQNIENIVSIGTGVTYTKKAEYKNDKSQSILNIKSLSKNTSVVMKATFTGENFGVKFLFNGYEGWAKGGGYAIIIENNKIRFEGIGFVNYLEKTMWKSFDIEIPDAQKIESGKSFVLEIGVVDFYNKNETFVAGKYLFVKINGELVAEHYADSVSEVSGTGNNLSGLLGGDVGSSLKIEGISEPQKERKIILTANKSTMQVGKNAILNFTDNMPTIFDEYTYEIVSGQERAKIEGNRLVSLKSGEVQVKVVVTNEYGISESEILTFNITKAEGGFSVTLIIILACSAAVVLVGSVFLIIKLKHKKSSEK